RVDGAHLVEVDLVGRPPVDLRLGLREQRERGDRAALRARREVGGLDERADLAEAAGVVVVVVVVIVRVLVPVVVIGPAVLLAVGVLVRMLVIVVVVVAVPG